MTAQSAGLVERLRATTLSDDDIAVIEAALAAPAADWLLVHWQAAQVAADALADWQAMFDAIPGLEKYERFTYGPAIEQARTELLAAAPQAQGEG